MIWDTRVTACSIPIRPTDRRKILTLAVDSTVYVQVSSAVLRSPNMVAIFKEARNLMSTLPSLSITTRFRAIECCGASIIDHQWRKSRVPSWGICPIFGNGAITDGVTVMRRASVTEKELGDLPPTTIYKLFLVFH